MQNKDITMNHDDYYHYLKIKSIFSNLYRKNYLYSTINYFLDGKAIDLGCGLENLLKYRENTIGFDINKRLVEYCKNFLLNVHLLKGDKLVFKDNYFDSAIMDNVLEHILEPNELIIKINRVLKNEGRFIVGVPGKKGFHADSNHKIFYDESSLINFIEKFGFKKIKILKLPISFSYVSKFLRIYCIYGDFKKID